MNLLKDFEISGQLFGQPITESSIQQAEDSVLGIQQNIGLIVLARNPHSSNQSIAQKAVEIMLDDMEFNLGIQVNDGEIKQSFAANCLQESLANINEFIIDQNQINTDKDLIKGISLSVIQMHSKGISCCMHGDLSSYKLSYDAFKLIGNKVDLAKSLGVNPNLNFTASEETLNTNDIVLFASNLVIEQLGIEFIRMTLSRFGDNMYMAIRQINSRAAKSNILNKISFLICRKTSSLKKNNGWFK